MVDFCHGFSYSVWREFGMNTPWRDEDWESGERERESEGERRGREVRRRGERERQ